tara:strand:- start:951 stop:1745 length:795 start_codon:yes stop_codon:yes gene_type:complete
MLDSSTKIQFQKNGFTTLDNFLNLEEISTLKEIVKIHCGSKIRNGNYFPKNFMERIKIIKSPKKIISSIKIMDIFKKYELKKMAEYLTGVKMTLTYIDGYVSEKSNKPVLDWHVDQSYSGKENVKTFVNPNKNNIKFFFYLTDVSTDNGCLGFIPGSNMIAFHLKDLIRKGMIEYSPYWSLKDFRKLVAKEETFNKLKVLINQDIVKNFLEITKFNNEDGFDLKKFNIPLSKGSLLVFDEAGVHKGNKPMLNDRYVLRFFFQKD